MKTLLIGIFLIGSFSSYAMSLDEVVKNLPKESSVKNIKMNRDGSVTLSNISIERGDQVYKIYFDILSQTMPRVCKFLGFDNVLRGKNLNISKQHTTKTSLAYLSDQGSFAGWRADFYFVDKVTCYSGDEPSPVILIDGQVYEKQ